MPKDRTLETAVAALTAAIAADDDKAGIDAIGTLLLIGLHGIQRVAVSAERIALALERAYPHTE